MGWAVSASGYRSVTNAATATMTIASPAVVTIPHCAVAGDKVVFTTTGALPTGVTAGQVYYVISAGLTGNAFEFSTTSGGSAVNTSGTQSGTHTATFEHIIATDTGNATYWMDFSLLAEIGGDTYELRAYDQILAASQPGPGNILAQGWKGTYAGPQANDHKYFPFIPSDQQIQFTVKPLANANSGTVTFTNGSANITFASNVLQQNDVVQFTTTGTLPTNFSTLTNYFVLTTGSPFTVSATIGGSAITAGSAGSGTQTVTRIGHSHAYKLLKQ